LFSSIFLGAVWILGNEQWMKIDGMDPRKVFALEVYRTMAARIPSIPARRNGAKGPAESSLNDFPGRNGSGSESSDRSTPEE